MVESTAEDESLATLPEDDQHSRDGGRKWGHDLQGGYVSVSTAAIIRDDDAPA